MAEPRLANPRRIDVAEPSQAPSPTMGRHRLALIALVLFWVALPAAGAVLVTSMSWALGLVGLAVSSLVVALLIGNN